MSGLLSRKACRRAVARSVGLAILVTGGAVAFAQNAPAQAAPQGAPADNAAPAAAPAGPSDSPAPAGSAAPGASASKGAVTGYAYKSSSASSLASSSPAPHHRHLLAHHANEAVATFTGFEMLADGGSRLFVQLSRQVDVGQETEKAAAAPAARKGKKARAAAANGAKSGVVARLKFVLKGAEVVNPMNEGALVTAHFNTPVVRARLVPAGHNLALVVELRADVTPQMKVVPAKDNGAMLQIDFPQGSYLPVGAPEPVDTAGTVGAAPGALPSSGGAGASGANEATETK